MTDPATGVLSPGTLFQGRYEIVRCIKAGGMGAVYECIHLQTRKRRALKIMLPQVLAKEDMRRRFELEARITAEIESEHIVETFDAGVDPDTGAPFLVMELLRGEDLGTWLAARGHLHPAQVALLFQQAALALEKTHAAGVVHRDLKPENFFLASRDDGSPRLKILDFGVAKIVADASQNAAATQALGTPLYMSPEQLTGDGAIDARSDLYALGHMAFTLLVGRPYWDDEQRSAEGLFPFLHKVLAGPPESPCARAARWGVALPPAFDAWFARAAARVPAQRFQTATALAHELAAALGAPRTPSGSLGLDASMRLGPLGAGGVPTLTPSGAYASPPAAASSPAWTTSANVSGGPALATPSGRVPIALPSGATPPLQTTTGISADSLSRPAPPSHTKLLVALAALATVILSAVVYVARDATSDEPRATGASPSAGLSVVAATPVPTATAAPIVPPTAAASAIPLAPPPAPPPTASSDAPPSSAAREQVAPTPSASASDAADPPRSPLPRPPTRPARNCNPPYTLDGANHRHYKLECL